MAESAELEDAFTSSVQVFSTDLYSSGHVYKFIKALPNLELSE